MRLFTFTRVSENSMIASVRIARFVSRTLGIPVITDETIDDGRSDDLLIIVNGAYAFCKFLPQLGAAIERAKKVAWIQNDYTIIPPKPVSGAESPFRRAFRARREQGQPDAVFWSTCDDWAKLPGSSYVNWNCLTFDENYDPRIIARRRRSATSDLFYYGSWRGGGGKSSREIYFDRYFQKPEIDVVVSSPAKQFSRYPVFCTPPVRENFYESIGTRGMGLYVEDRMSHDHYHSPANRFYEMLSAGLPMVFQPECGMGLRRAGYDPAGFYAEKPKNVASMMSLREKIGEQQRELWADRAVLESRDLPNQLRKAMSRL